MELVISVSLVSLSQLPGKPTERWYVVLINYDLSADANMSVYRLLTASLDSVFTQMNFKIGSTVKRTIVSPTTLSRLKECCEAGS